MASIAQLVKLRKQAEKAVADMSDHDLKLAEFEVLFEYLLEEAEDEADDDDGEQEAAVLKKSGEIKKNAKERKPG